MDKALDELRRLAANAENRRTETGIPRVAMVQGQIPEHALAAVYEPMINLILQGSKSMTVGGKTLHYDPATYFIMSVDLPAVGAVHPASTGEPYLAVSLTLDANVVSALLCDTTAPANGCGEPSSQTEAFNVAAVTPDLMDAWVRMLRLMERPNEIPALAPAYEREILYRVLQGPQGYMLRQLATPDSALARISSAIQRIRRDYSKPLRIASLAEQVAMSESSFHRHFKSATALSPLQYQKQLRLLQARQILATQGKSVTTAALEVGYESPTQFTREYTRAFGLPPSQDAARMVASWRGKAAH
ncbi:AraC-like DNA-binding protein [Xanthomonas campestris]|jgi:AraC-like DNA-binding protein|uniref:AraC family transcriptional regulator n=1 Tax=Xanthomonas euroxanthea TaxID=2259622 RepID=UPI000CEECCDF|nr:AraC family transcriptional regulator [Xanthomonas euroxanthea]NIJ91525.1 AraC-like DNA-binding protein [Xanthomonas euroxanthea]PPT32474.1 AraC family transcriptional regulator [Xanthomonas arboricola]